MGTFGPNNGNTFVSDGTLGSITMANRPASLFNQLKVGDGLSRSEVAN